MSRRALKLIHTSDVHLGGWSSPERRVLIEGAFRRVVDLAIREEADALLIAGDFFDNDRIGDDVVQFAAEQLNRYPGPSILVPGNHDPLDEGRLYARTDLPGAAPRLRMLREHAGEIARFEELDLVVWGRGYHEADWGFRPLEGIPARDGATWHIAMGHGHVVRAGQDPHRSLPIQQAEIEALAGQWDYLALGHWEPHADVSTGGMTAVYSGAPMPLSDANRLAGWAIIVELDERGTTWRREWVDPRPREGQGK